MWTRQGPEGPGIVMREHGVIVHCGTSRDAGDDLPDEAVDVAAANAYGGGDADLESMLHWAICKSPYRAQPLLTKVPLRRAPRAVILACCKQQAPR